MKWKCSCCSCVQTPLSLWRRPTSRLRKRRRTSSSRSRVTLGLPSSAGPSDTWPCCSRSAHHSHTVLLQLDVLKSVSILLTYLSQLSFRWWRTSCHCQLQSSDCKASSWLLSGSAWPSGSNDVLVQHINIPAARFHSIHAFLDYFQSGYLQTSPRQADSI